MMTFNEWLNDQKHRDDPIGDLANDAAQDRNFPEVESFADLDKYFAWQGFPGKIHEDVMNAVTEAWEEYETVCNKTK